MTAIDLHVHSTASDGTYSPKELVEYAMTKKLSAIAITDHDTVGGVEEAVSHGEFLRSTLPAEEASKVPEIIPGIELSTEYEGRDVHIVGLYINTKAPAFAGKLQEFVDSRTARNHKMCALLQEHGLDITYQELVDAFPGAVLTRAHYAKLLLSKGYVKSIKEAFDRYVGDYAPCFIPREKVTPEQGIQLILSAGGVPILAHPMLYHMSGARLDTLVATLKEAGLVGIEAIYSTYKACDEREVRNLAAKHELLISGGSDFHGLHKPGLDLGLGYGHLFVPDSLLPAIKAAAQSIS